MGILDIYLVPLFQFDHYFKKICRKLTSEGPVFAAPGFEITRCLSLLKKKLASKSVGKNST